MNKEENLDAIVRFEHVSLSYGQTSVLNDFSLDVKRGECMPLSEVPDAERLHF